MATKKLKKRPAAKKRTPAKAKAKAAKKPVAKAKIAKAKKPVAKAKKPVARKSSGPRKPPMHAKPEAIEVDAPETERDETFEIFKSFDRDGSGSIDRSELSRLLEALGQTVDEDELTIAISVIDANDSGRISWDEFKSWWSNR